MKTQTLHSLQVHPQQVLQALRKTRRPVLLTRRGKPAAYLVDPATFEAAATRMQILEGIARGERAIDEGRTLSQAAAKKKMERWLK